MKLRFIIWIMTICSISTIYGQVRIISYNVENLFDCQHDSLKNDSSFLPTGTHHWTYPRYYTKLNRIAQVIVNISGWESTPLVGLCEVENARCLRDLCYRLRCFHYRFIHYDSPDERGIDVALLYDSTKVQILNSRALSIPLVGDYTRDVLYACCLIHQQDTIHTMVCHLPSQLGGSANTEHKRIVAKQVIQHHIDSILYINPQAKIVVMGDMNQTPVNDLDKMNNLMLAFEQEQQGTHKFQGIWTCLDQFYVSHAIYQHATTEIFAPEWILEEDTKYLDVQPKRTYISYRYHDGYSDHLPIVLNF